MLRDVASFRREEAQNVGSGKAEGRPRDEETRRPGSSVWAPRGVQAWARSAAVPKKTARARPPNSLTAFSS